jgi:hypothetical protein
MNRPTVCISSIVKEPYNITGFEEPQGAVETEDSSRGNQRSPLRHGEHNDMKKTNSTYMSGH